MVADRLFVQPPAYISSQLKSEVGVLYREHSAALMRTAATVARDRSIIQDGIQEAFLRFIIARINGAQVENPRAWLVRVLKNYILDCNRNPNTLRSIDLDAAGDLVDSGQDVEADFDRKDTFQHAISILSGRERECIMLRLRGLDYHEIAQVLKIKSGTVGTLLARGAKKIRNTCSSVM